MAIEQYPVVKFNPRSIYRKRVNTPQRRATIGLPEKVAAAGVPLAWRQIEAPIQETGPEAMSITDGEASTQPQMITETQQPIQNRGSSARYMIQGGGPRIDLSFLVPERANPSYDPNKAIGGENVPYMESKGVGGFFRRLLGDESNRMNIEAQQAQGAEWRDKALREEERTAGIATYRAQREIDQQLENARDDKRNAHAIAMFDKAQAAQKELLRLQQDFTKTQSADERAAILDRIRTQHTNALDLQTRALAASEKNLGLQQAFQSRMANFNAQLDDYANKNRITSLGGGFFSRGGALYSATPGTPGFKDIPGTEPKVSEPLMEPRVDAELPQLDVNAPTITSPRFQLPSVSLQESPISNTQPPETAVPDKSVPTVDKPKSEIGKPAPSTNNANTPSTEEGEEIQGLFPAIGEHLSSGEGLSLAQEAPTTAYYRTGFSGAASDVGRSISEGVRSIKPLFMGGRLPRYSKEEHGGVLGMFLNAPGAIFSPIEAAGNYALQNPVRSMTGVDPRAGKSVLRKAQDPETLYMSDAEYKNYLRRQRLTQ